MIHTKLVLLSVFAALLTGCGSTKQARDVQTSSYLGGYRSQLAEGSEEGALRLYKNPSADWRSYHKILLTPVIIWDGGSSKLDSQQRDDLQRLADSFYDMLYRRLSKDYEMTEQPSADVMRIQVAITHAEKSWVAPAFMSKAVPQLRAADTLWNFASGKPAFAGEIAVEFKVHDAQTAELLAAGADRRVGGQNLIDKEIFNSWGDAKHSLEFWAEGAAYRLCVLRGETGCEEPRA
ncbi:MAG: DUF3313 domain-containing protein [Nitrospira sp.]